MLNGPCLETQAGNSIRWQDGYLVTGDIGYLDDDGFLYISDRKTDMIISGGVNIYPAESEKELINHPAVADVACIGVPNAELGVAS